MAVWNNRPRVVRFLLNSHCHVNVRDRYGDTPLMLSARRGFPDIMKAGIHSLLSPVFHENPPITFELLAICRPSGFTEVSGVVVGVCNRSQMRTGKCTCLIFGVSVGLDPR